MKYINNSIKSVVTGMLILLLGISMSIAAPPSSPTPVFDTSFALEYSYSCLGGGCHETDQKLVEEHAASKMTHTMVKCNACHGTHTAETVGLDKPNLTGYYPGIGATGYKVDTDRCNACHNNEHSGGGKKSGDNCYSCHTPHAFDAGGR